MGFALGAGLYAGVESLPGGWRSLYLVGLGPLLLMPLFRRSLQETRRYQAHARTRSIGERSHPLLAWAKPVVLLMRARPGRTAAVGLAGMLAAMSTIAFFQYTSYFLQNVYGWAPGHYTLLVYGGGILGLLGNIVGGRGSDRWGRKRVGVITMLLLPASVAFFYQGPGATLAIAWGLAALCATSNELIIRAVSTELFPTSHRGAASGWLILVQTIGWSSGLFIVALNTESITDLRWAISMVAFASLGAALCLLMVPETRSLELETITDGESAEAPPAA
jgi:predicted MFS family arabinose efflux permease